ncbi:class I SAM-dependent methyltransferase [Nakamurella flava]|uniref:Class I SAM-dependent methyltransferase n=1 Tax=Nakamurella flava TaxID=2576308 RepID=A0A4U6QLY5_9ACTN|nr:class I SAM-dependent methyltransferase [Nakamurella flava]TKV61590.1 class I SAM-dependent methyltransferase [Nakamurella flava]
MPMSSAEGKDWTRERIQQLSEDPITVLDIGPGVGTYAKLLAGPNLAHITGIEIWEPYVHTYRLKEYYDEVIVGDAREVEFPTVDVVVLGDVAEHMSEPDALRLWERAAAAARRAVYLSIPIVHYPQGHIEGNPHEHHVVDDWDHDRVLATFPGIGESWRGTEVGVYERRTDGGGTVESAA